MDNATLDFVSPDEQTFNYWTDGINALLGQPMVSKQKDDDFETLLSMEIKLRLLDTEGIDISESPPIRWQKAQAKADTNRFAGFWNDR